MEIQNKKFADLEARVLKIKGDAAFTETATIFLHGAGASMDDLIPLCNYLPGLQTTDLYFLNAPFEMMPPHPMYIWFNVGELVEKMNENGFSEEIMKTFVPTRIEEGRSHLKKAMQEITPNYKKVQIVGFSQGGMMAVDFGLEEPKLSKLALLSTSLCDHQTLKKKVGSLATGVKIFQSHGHQDAVLPFAYGEYLSKFFAEHGIKSQFESFNGGHEIPM
ncbi:hypothetical protein N9W79_02285, partial [bacterium]|nr:hypothetical protein [bacterium]